VHDPSLAQNLDVIDCVEQFCFPLAIEQVWVWLPLTVPHVCLPFCVKQYG
jgi:hypothetical protein